MILAKTVSACAAGVNGCQPRAASPNVWVVIWPNQKKILGLVSGTDEQKDAARKTTLYATRAKY